MITSKSKSPVLLVALLGISFAHAQQMTTGAPISAPVPEFKSADVNGRTLRYRCDGQGSPTVVVEQGGGISPGLNDTPLIVLTRNPNAPRGSLIPADWAEASEGLHQKLQVDLAKLSSNGKHVLASKAGHNIQFEEPQLVIDSILELVQRARRE